MQTTSLARTVVDFADSALDSISKNPYDLPFALLYMVSPVTPKPSLKEIRTGVEARLRLGVEVKSCVSRTSSLPLPPVDDSPSRFSGLSRRTTRPPFSRQGDHH